MADIKYEYSDCDFTIDTYDNVLKTFEWIKGALESIIDFSGKLEIYAYPSFKVGKMSYSCKSIEEFKKYAFEKKIVDCSLSVWVSGGFLPVIISVTAVYHESDTAQGYTIESTDENLVIDLQEALKQRKGTFDSKNISTTLNFTDNSVHIGNNNSISQSVISSNIKTDKEVIGATSNTKDPWYSKLLWQILIPLVVGVAIVAICVAIGLN